MPSQWMSVRVDDKLHERISAAAKADQRSVSAWVRIACERILSAQPEAPAARETEPSR